jgi:hypothetical protein
MTGYQSKKKAASAKTIDEVNWLDHEPDGRRAEQDATMQSLKDLWRSVCDEVGKAAFAQPALEQNFCERCGKRTADLTTIHTCTPPQEKNG